VPQPRPQFSQCGHVAIGTSGINGQWHGGYRHQRERLCVCVFLGRGLGVGGLGFGEGERGERVQRIEEMHPTWQPSNQRETEGVNDE